MIEDTEWSYLWKDITRYALVSTKSSGLLIVDTEMKTAIIIEDDPTNEYVTTRMIEAGARILDHFP
jgi:hypothetical protein